jgi:xanthine/CO dehydrogenase XdhC/CoxF family maturation factor
LVKPVWSSGGVAGMAGGMSRGASQIGFPIRSPQCSSSNRFLSELFEARGVLEATAVLAAHHRPAHDLALMKEAIEQ